MAAGSHHVPVTGVERELQQRGQTKAKDSEKEIARAVAAVEVVVAEVALVETIHRVQ